MESGTGKEKSYVHWTNDMDRTISSVLLDEHGKGHKTPNGWKAVAFTAAIKTMKDLHNLDFTKENIMARLKTWNKYYKEVSVMLDTSGFGWDWERNTVKVDSEDVWANYIRGVYYYFYQIFRDRAEAASLARQSIGLGDGSIGMLQSLVVAAFAGSVNVLLTNPIWVVVTRMQTHKKTSTSSASLVLPIIQDEVVQDVEPPPYGTIDVVQELYGESGLLGLWKGVFPTLIMVSNPSIQFMLYEAMLKNLKKKRASSSKWAVGLTALEIFLLGAVAKLGATLVTYPLNVVKARLQAKQCLEMDRRDHYQGTGDAIRKMIRHEGFGSFYKGMRTKIVQSVLAAAILFMVKEELVKASKLLLTRSRVKPSR